MEIQEHGLDSGSETLEERVPFSLGHARALSSLKS